jgi:hypothetical protein
MAGKDHSAVYREQLPQLSAEMFLTEGGIETTLIFDTGSVSPTSPRSSYCATTMVARAHALLRHARRLP